MYHLIHYQFIKDDPHNAQAQIILGIVNGLMAKNDLLIKYLPERRLKPVEIKTGYYSPGQYTQSEIYWDKDDPEDS